jgi:two-component system, chemotaxis family, sensor kinase CheA
MTDNSEEAFLKELRATFAAEAQEHLQTLATGLVELETATTPVLQQALIETVFRGVHSLKGAARAVEDRAVEALCQSMESVLSALKHQRLEFRRALADLLHDALDALARLLADVSSDAPSPSLIALCARLDGAALGEPPPQPVAVPPDATGAISSAPPLQIVHPPPFGVQSPASPQAAALQPVLPQPGLQALAPHDGQEGPPPTLEEQQVVLDTVRIAASKLDSLLRQAEGLLAAKLSAEQRVLDVDAIAASVAALHKQSAPGSLAGDARAADLRRLNAQVDALHRSAYGDWQALSARVDQLLEEMKKISMLPAGSALRIFPKLVRDLARASEKEIALQLSGGEIEIDRRILEEIRDPLIHLVRNCVDHGIEKPAERQRRGKSAQGSIVLSVAQRDGGRVEILVGDDGGGIDLERVRTAARQQQSDSGRDLTDIDTAALLDLVFQSGLSTSPLITDISGRGLGLAIVRDKIERLGGTIELQSQAGSGTQFRIVLPVTLATYRGVQVRCGSRHFVFPTTLVEFVTTIRRDAIRSVENRATATVQGRVVAVVQLAELLGLPARPDPAATASLVIVATGVGSPAEKRIAFLVDEVVDEQEVLVKGLGEQLQRVRNIAGVARLRTGVVALIVNVVDLMKSATQSGGRGGGLARGGEQRRSILVAEDSITSRMLLKGMLESVGYRVTVAVDGEDALARLRAESFDLVVSDVDMPRLSGLQLTAKIRADSALAGLPVVLVTTLASAADRERGAEVGASAYLVKSSFEQSNLLDVVRRLLP